MLVRPSVRPPVVHLLTVLLVRREPFQERCREGAVDGRHAGGAASGDGGRLRRRAGSVLEAGGGEARKLYARRRGTRGGRDTRLLLAVYV